MDEFLDALTAKERDALPDEKFALPKKRMFPIHNKTHIKMAWDMVDRAKGLSDSERQTARKNILKAAKEAGIDTSDWDKSAMTDAIFERPEVLLDSANAEQAGQLPAGIIMRVRCKGTRADVINSHGRTYPKAVILDALEEAKSKWDPIESPHPAPYTDAQGNVRFRSNLDNRVGRIFGEPWMDSDGWVWFDADLFDTTKGRNTAAMVRAGEAVGVSLRSFGKSVKKVINDSLVSVATKMSFRTWDVVPDPATEGCGTEQVVLTDSQLQTITDGLGFSDPVCPIDGTMLQPFDPDKDNDVDFWACPKCASRYDVYNGVQVSVQGNQQIYRRWDSPDLGQGRTSPTPPPVPDPAGAAIVQTDSQSTNPEGARTVELTAEQIQEMIRQANAPFQTILDSQEAQRQADAKKAEAKAFLDSKFEEIQPKYSAPVLEAIRKAIGQPQTKEAAEIVMDSVLDMAGQVSASEFLTSLGFTPGASPQGHTSVQVTHEPKPWKPLTDSMLQEFDRISAEKGHFPDPELRKRNMEIVTKIVDKFESKDVGYQQMSDSMRTVEALLDSGASVTTSQMLNQPTVQTVILIQKFQDTEAIQFMMADTFEGQQWQIPSETFQGAATVDPSSLIYDIVVAENSAIQESQVDVVWSSFTPKPRRNAISLTTDVIRGMETGPLKYNAPARSIYHIGREASRRVDLAAYYDMAVTSDEYLPLAVASETVTASAVSNGTNVKFKGQLTIGGKAGTTITLSNGQPFTFAPQGYCPIVRPRSRQIVQLNGTVQTTTPNPIACTVGGTPLTIGALDSNGNIVGTGAQYAINFETGDIYFVAGVGIVVGTTNPVVSYSASTNYDVWHTTMGSGYSKIEDWYNTFVQQISATAALMGSSPRFNAPNLALFSLNNSLYVRNAQIFYKLADPAGQSLTPTKNFFGTRDETDLFKLNAPTILGDGRVLLTQKNATRYGIQTPYKIEGPITKQDQSSGLLLPVKAWYGEEFSCICTPQVVDANGNTLNPVSRTIRIVP